MSDEHADLDRRALEILTDGCIVAVDREGRLTYKPLRKYARYHPLMFDFRPAPAEPEGAKLTADRARRQAERAKRDETARERAHETVLEGLHAFWSEATQAERDAWRAVEPRTDHDREDWERLLTLSGYGFDRDLERMERAGAFLAWLAALLRERWGLA